MSNLSLLQFNGQNEDLPRYVVSLLGREIQAAHRAQLNSILDNHQLEIQQIQRLSAQCLEISVTGTPNDSIRADLLALSQRKQIDIGFQEDNLLRRHRRLIVFDMDSTLIQCEVMDELAKVAGVGEQVIALTEAAMRGEMDFNTSFRRRLATLKGLDETVLQQIAATLPITEGAARLISTLKKLGYRVAILSGGFSYFANHLKTQLGVDDVFANELDIVDGKLTGKVKGEIVNGETKARVLRALAEEMDISLQQTIAVGDGANDLPMINIAGLGIAYHAKPVVQATAKHAISNVGLDGILYYLGMHDRDINTLNTEIF
jgi:phosphoserine phosphatase